MNGSGTLRDVTLAGTLNVTGNTAARVSVAGAGLTLQGGSVNLNDASALLFSGTQTLGGSVRPPWPIPATPVTSTDSARAIP